MVATGPISGSTNGATLRTRNDISGHGTAFGKTSVLGTSGSDLHRNRRGVGLSADARGVGGNRLMRQICRRHDRRASSVRIRPHPSTPRVSLLPCEPSRSLEGADCRKSLVVGDLVEVCEVSFVPFSGHCPPRARPRPASDLRRRLPPGTCRGEVRLRAYL